MLRWMKGVLICACLFVAGLSGCATVTPGDGLKSRIEPSNDRDWSPELSVLPTVDFQKDSVVIHNIRNCQYLNKDDFIVQHYDRTIPISRIQSVDFIVVPFKSTPALAHTMLSFGLDDGSYLGVSVEVRKEKNEKYQPLLGISNQYEIMYVVADEKDLIRLRTRHREDNVYVFPTVATPKQSQDLFVNVMRRVNQLAGQPEFYHTLSNNCTTNLVSHVNELKQEKIPFNWKVLLPGFSARYAYDLGLLDNRIDFEDLESISFVNELAEKYFDAPDFSQKIRSNRTRIERAAARASRREAAIADRPSLESSGRLLRR